MSEVKVECLDDAMVVVLSFTGENHRTKNICNQDTYSYSRNSAGNFAFVVADGVSSCKNAKIGSETICKVILDLLPVIENMTEEEIRKTIFSNWKNSIAGNWNEYGSTLNFCYKLSNRFIIGKIGDGVIFAKYNNKECILKENAEFYTSETFALGEVLPKNAFDVYITECSDSDAFFLFLATDGIIKEVDEDSFDDFSNYIEKNIENEGFVLELKDWVKSLNKNNGDDKTILICKIKGKDK